MRRLFLLTFFSFFGSYSGQTQQTYISEGVPYSTTLSRIITNTTKWETDDPAIWINFGNLEKNLDIGTNKKK